VLLGSPPLVATTALGKDSSAGPGECGGQDSAAAIAPAATAAVADALGNFLARLEVEAFSEYLGHGVEQD
jgi:hypothetical protein